MVKKKAPSEDRSALAGLRARIAQQDRQIVELLQARAKLAAEAAALESPEVGAGGAAVGGQAVEAILAASGGPLADRCIRTILQELESGCRELVSQVKVAFLGPLYSYSHLAVMHHFGQSVELVPVATIAAVFEEVRSGQANYGLVPIENSTDGRIADTLDMFIRLPLRVCGEVAMRIHHTLLGLCPRSEITDLYSKPQAISQCRNWIAQHLPAARTVEVTSTAVAAELAHDKPGAAAIASVQAGVHYGLNVLAECIEDNAANTTRFAVIGGHSAPRSGNDKTALLFQVAHRPGALADVLNLFKRSRLNLTWIESFPIPDRVREYLFFAELEGHESDTRVRRAMASLQKRAIRLEVLGSFPVPATVD